MAGRPNLFIIGAMKSGTTSLHNYLDMHPEVAMSEEKEPGYFVAELSLERGADWYAVLFESDSQYRYRGESSTHYTKLPLYRGVAERIFRFAPDARLIYVMRDPFERAVSHYWHAVRDVHHGGELRRMIKAVTEQPSDYLAFSDYAMQLEPYIKLFGRDAIFTLTFESLVRDPQAELNRIFEWLGLPAHSIGEHSSKAHNQKPENIVGVAGAGILNRIQYSSVWDRISPLVPARLKGWAKGLAYRKVDAADSTAELEILRNLVADTQQRQIDSLSRLLNRDFPEWTQAARSIRARSSGASEAAATTANAKRPMAYDSTTSV
jgi:hypothetical protein